VIPYLSEVAERLDSDFRNGNINRDNRSQPIVQDRNLPWIEHVLPERPVDEWFKTFTREQHEKVKDLLANLLPLSQQMNQALGNRPYADKKTVYLDDSGFKATREFAKQYTEWTPVDLTARSKILSDWAISRWPWKE
jgi:hypothetical protein